MKTFDFKKFKKGSTAVMFYSIPEWENFYELVKKELPGWNSSGSYEKTIPGVINERGECGVSNHLGCSGWGVRAVRDFYVDRGLDIIDWKDYMPRKSFTWKRFKKGEVAVCFRTEEGVDSFVQLAAKNQVEAHDGPINSTSVSVIKAKEGIMRDDPTCLSHMWGRVGHSRKGFYENEGLEIVYWEDVVCTPEYPVDAFTKEDLQEGDIVTVACGHEYEVSKSCTRATGEDDLSGWIDLDNYNKGLGHYYSPEKWNIVKVQRSGYVLFDRELAPEFTKKDLKNGDIVAMRDGEEFIYYEDELCFVNKEHTAPLSIYSHDLMATNLRGYDIAAVCREGKTIFTRNDVVEPRKVTMQEISEKFGEEVQIVED